jgi:hypothetical protein
VAAILARSEDRVGYEEDAAMTKSGKGKDGKKAAGPGQLWLHLPGVVREALYDTVIGAGLACVDEALEAERVALCGERYEHLADRQALRAGHVASSLVLGGRRVAVQRPRARSIAGRELKLPSWREWSARDPLDENRWCWAFRRAAMRVR